ncbi:MAG: hypothetical protein HC807_07375, partial [Gammaproteobacteria bacterium]|nr:hypothetical protein [Gammaproteobacteria bacterium]
MRLSRAAATSSAVPVVLSAVTYNNYGGTCGYQYPAWVADVAKSEGRARPSARAFQRYIEMQAFQDGKNRPYLHLVDGGVSDNIGVRGIIETLEELGASAKFRGEVGFGVVRRIVLLVVNSQASPSTDWDREEDPPGMISQLLQSTGVPIDRYSFETVETLKDRAEILKWRRELLVRAPAARRCERGRGRGEDPRQARAFGRDGRCQHIGAILGHRQRDAVTQIGRLAGGIGLGVDRRGAPGRKRGRGGEKLPSMTKTPSFATSSPSTRIGDICCSCVVSACHLSAGSANALNVIPADVQIGGTPRIPSRAHQLEAEIGRLAMASLPPWG